MPKPPQSLTELLFLWLHSPTRAASDKNFSAFYNAIHDSLLRKLYFAGLQYGTSAEDTLQELFIYFLKKLGADYSKSANDSRPKPVKRNRPEAATYICSQLELLNTSQCDQFQHWSQKMRQWVDDAMAFGSPPHAPSFAWLQETHAINVRLKPLLTEGKNILSNLCGELHAVDTSIEDDAVTEDDETDDLLEVEAMFLVQDDSNNDIEKEEGIETTDDYLTVKNITNDAPKVIVPAIAFFYTKAVQMALDYLRKLNKLREEEMPQEPTSDSEDSDASGSHYQQPTKLWDVGQEYVTSKGHEYVVGSVVPSQDNKPANNASIISSNAQTKSYNPDSAFPLIWAALYAEVEKAQVAKTQASNARELRKADMRVAKAMKTYLIRIDILEFLCGGYTKKAIASEMGLTRDQVRYQIENIMYITRHLRT